MPTQSDKLRLLRRIPDIRFEEELRGYSKSQVDRVLENLAPLADELEALQTRLAEAETRAASAEARLLENTGASQAQELETPTAPLTPVVAAASPAPTLESMPATPADFDETLKKTLLLAQRTADETVKEAYDEAERVRNNAHNEADQFLGTAKSEAEQIEADTAARREEVAIELNAERARLLDEARTEVEAKRAAIEKELLDAEGAERTELLEQIANLQELRSALTADIEVLEAFLAERQETVRAAVAEISTVVEDPSRLRTSTEPVLAEITPLDASDYDEVAISSDSLENLMEGESHDDSTSSEASAFTTDTTSAVNDADVEGESLVEGITDTTDDTTEAVEQREGIGAGDRETDGFVESTTSASTTSESAIPEAPSSDPIPSQPESTAFASPVTERTEPTWAADADVDGALPDASGSEDLSAEDQLLQTGTVPAPPSAPGLAVGVGPDPDAAGPATQEFSFAEMADDGDVVADDSWPDTASDAPASGWDGAAPVATEPPPPVVQDPFLDQLRRATSEEEGASDDALDRFLEGDGEEDRKGWFGRKR